MPGPVIQVGQFYLAQSKGGEWIPTRTAADAHKFLSARLAVQVARLYPNAKVIL